MSKRRARPDRSIAIPGSIAPDVAQLLSEPLGLSSIAHETRELKKRAIAKRVLPFFKEIAAGAEAMQVSYNREKLELIVEACRDYLMAEAEADKDLDEERKMAVAEIVTGLAKGWAFARELLDHGAMEHLLPFYVVTLEHLEEISAALEIKVVDRGLSREVLEQLAWKTPIETRFKELENGPSGSPSE